MKYVSVLLFAFLTACAGYDGADGAKGAAGPAGPVGPPGPGAPVVMPTAIEQIVANENAYRESLGQTALTKGLSCSVQAVSSGQFLSSSSPGYTAAAGVLVLTGSSYPYLLTKPFNQADGPSGPNSVIDPAIQPLFLNNNYKISCSGQLVVSSDGYDTFALSSDDGAILTIDGTQVINNDGNHGVTTVSGTKALRSDVVHTFSLLYAQSGAGNFALVLKMNGVVLPAANLYH